VLLYSWTFTAAQARPGGGSFRDLAGALSTGLFGLGAPGVADTGHRPLTLHDRTGSDQAVWYRGPLVARPVPRDTLGPYHAADQARQFIPGTDAEDVSYAAAFELGRLLGTADGRLAQELMGWRREAYQASARHSVAGQVWTDVPAIATSPAAAAVGGMTSPVALTMVERAGSGAGEAADLTRALAVRAAPGLNPRSLAAAWNLSPGDAERLLSDPEASPPAPPAETTAAPVTADDLQAARRLVGATSQR
jgi:hypothetical protein